MGLKTVLGFSLKPVAVDPDGLSAPPDPSELAPPSGHPRGEGDAADQDAGAPEDAVDDIYAGLLSDAGNSPVSEPVPSGGAPVLAATRRELEPAPGLAAAFVEASEPAMPDAHDEAGADAAGVDGDHDGAADEDTLHDEHTQGEAEAPYGADAHESSDGVPYDSAHDDDAAGAAVFSPSTTRMEGLPALAALDAASNDVAADSVDSAVVPVRKRGAKLSVGRIKNFVVATAALSSLPLAGAVLWLSLRQQPSAPATVGAHAAAGAEHAAPAHAAKDPPEPAGGAAHAAAKHAEEPAGKRSAESHPPPAHGAARAHAETPHTKAEKPAESPASEGHAAAEAPPAHEQSDAAQAKGACKLERLARRLARDVSPRVPLEAERLSSGDVLIGYAGTSADARGLTMDPATLRARESFKEAGTEQVWGVVPWSTEANAPFVVDREGAQGAWRTLPGASGLALQHDGKQLSLVHRGGRHPSPLWALAADSVSRPAVVSAGDQRYALALREGDERGQVRYGWLDARSQRQSALLTLPLGAAEVGVPSLALRDHELLIATALRDREDGPWRIELWQAQGKAPPNRVRLPSLRQSLDDQIAPRVVALNGDRWALQWTTGRAGERRVDLLVLDSELNPIAAPLALSKRRTSAGAGLLIAAPPRLISLYLVQSGERYDLWAQALAC